MKWKTTPPMRRRCRAQTGSDRPVLFPGNDERYAPVGAAHRGLWRTSPELFFQNPTNGIGRRIAAKGTGVVAGTRIFQQPGGLEQPRPFLAGCFDAGELGRKCLAAALRGASGCAERVALLRIAGTDDDR